MSQVVLKSNKKISLVEKYFGTEVTFVRFYLSCAQEILWQDILCRGHQLLSCAHEIIKWCTRYTISRPQVTKCANEIFKWCARDTMPWPLVTKFWERDNKVVRTRYYVVVANY
jgi:hypothetical protein